MAQGCPGWFKVFLGAPGVVPGGPWVVLGGTEVPPLIWMNRKQEENSSLNQDENMNHINCILVVQKGRVCHDH